LRGHFTGRRPPGKLACVTVGVTLPGRSLKPWIVTLDDRGHEKTKRVAQPTYPGNALPVLTTL
jgi:hypothetical protein